MRKSKYIKHWLNKENQILKAFLKPTTTSVFIPEPRTGTKTQCNFHNPSKKSMQKQKSYSVNQTSIGDCSRTRYRSQKKEVNREKHYQSRIDEKKTKSSVKKDRNYTSEGKTKKEELMEWYAQIERDYETAQRRFDCEMVKLNMRGGQIANSKVGLLNNKRPPMAIITEERNTLPINFQLPQRRLQKVSVKTQSNTIEITKFLELLKQQIELQSKLRQFKHKLNSQNTTEIEKILFDQHQVPSKYIKLLPEQYDPFIKQSQVLSNHEIAKSIKHWLEQSAQHWKQEMKCKFTKYQIEEFFRLLDFDQQNYVDLKTFVRELSILLKMNLRKRDVLRIFEKLSEGQIITLTSLLKELGNV